MAKFRKIDTRIWNDAEFNALSERGKLVFFFQLTHPNLTMLGAMRASIPGLSAELGMQSEAFAEAFGEAFAKGMVKHDRKACFLWLPNFLKYNRPESPNVVKAWPEAFDLLPECTLKTELFQHVKDFTEGLSEGFQEAFAHAFAKGMPNQEQEQEQDIYIRADESAPVTVSARSRTTAMKRSIELTDEDLRTVYIAYPRRKAPRDAIKAICKAVERVASEDGTTQREALSKLKARVEAYARQVKLNGIEEQFIPYPATWFNEGRYDDDDLAVTHPKPNPAPIHEFKSTAIPLSKLTQSTQEQIQ